MVKMCNCRKELDKKISELLKTEGQIVNFDLISGQTYSDFEYKVGKKTKRQLLIHTYCPFCGKRYNEELL
jgi:hypothetical protein